MSVQLPAACHQQHVRCQESCTAKLCGGHGAQRQHIQVGSLTCVAPGEQGGECGHHHTQTGQPAGWAAVNQAVRLQGRPAACTQVSGYKLEMQMTSQPCSSAHGVQTLVCVGIGGEPTLVASHGAARKPGRACLS